MEQRVIEGCDVSRETPEQLAALEALVLKWNLTINLVSRRDIDALWQRHIADSLQLARLVPSGARTLLDIGSGAGFPGLVLAIATNLDVDLIESDARKSAFLREAIRVTGAKARVHAIRIETLAPRAADVVSARAFAPLGDLLPLAHRHLATGGVALFPKGQTAEIELTAARSGWQMRVERFPSQTDPLATLFRLSEISPGPS